MANENPTVDETGDHGEMPAKRSVTAEGAFDVVAPKIAVEDRSSYGSRFAHDEHHSAAQSDVQPDGEAAIEENNRDQPWDLARIGRVVAYSVAGAGIHRLVRRVTRRQRRISMLTVLGAAVAAVGVGTWLARRNA